MGDAHFWFWVLVVFAGNCLTICFLAVMWLVLQFLNGVVRVIGS